jgi:hypothetical protein
MIHSIGGCTLDLSYELRDGQRWGQAH